MATPQIDWDDPVIAVFKIGAATHIDALVNRGTIFMNPASFFAGLERSDPRHDADEGASYCEQATGATLSVQIDGKFEQIGTLTGPIINKPDDLAAANVFCLHIRRASEYDKAFSLASLGFGDTVAIFLDVAEFLRRVKAAAEREGYQVSYQTVECVERESYTGPMGLFRKFSTKAAEQEFRIVVFPGIAGPLSLDVGPLTDITVTVPVEGLLKLSRKEAST